MTQERRQALLSLAEPGPQGLHVLEELQAGAAGLAAGDVSSYALGKGLRQFVRGQRVQLALGRTGRQ
jgi:hypothetical protein